MKKIALIMDGWKRFFTYAWPAGILERIRETKEDVNLYIFNSSGDWSWDNSYNAGEYNIYNLPDLSQFDGIIVDFNNVRYPLVISDIANKIRMSGKPAISISKEMTGFYYVGIDNYKTMLTMMEHLYEVHNCRRFWFIMGSKDNYENSIRAAAIRNFMETTNLEYSESDFYFDSYEYMCGYQGFMNLATRVRDRDDLPDAVVCANDNIAVGVIEAAAKKGYKVPDDFCVTGFDNFDKAGYYSPRITTASYIREEIGYCCAELLINIWNGENVNRFNFTDATHVFWDSCGCRSDIEVERVIHDKNQILYEIETSNFEEQILHLEYELINCRSIKQMSACIPSCIPVLRCEAMYIVLDEHIYDFRKKSKGFDINVIENERFMITGYPERMRIEFACDINKCSVNGVVDESDVHVKINDEADRSIKGIFPTFEYDKGGTDFLFMPLHFRSHTIGYFVIRNASYLMEKQYLFRIVNALNSAIENLHEKEKMEYINKILAELSVKDPMTGLYNRLGFQNMGCVLFDEMKARGENLHIMFVDMDRLKGINDRFGHEFGDKAICTLADVIKEYCEKTDIPIRNGGDEFLIIRKAMSEAEYNILLENMRKKLGYECKKRRLPFEITFSAGGVCTDMSTMSTLDDYIRTADEIMYREKLRKHSECGVS